MKARISDDPYSCDGCGKKSTLMIQVGEEENYDTRTADLCPSCVEDAWRLLQEAGR